MKKFELITDSAGRWEIDGSPVPMRHKNVKEMRKLFVPLRGVATFVCRYRGSRVDIRVSDLRINDLGYIVGDVEDISLYIGDWETIRDTVKRSCGVNI